MADNSVLNVEEGAEYTVRNGDSHAERNLNEYGTDTEPYAPAGRINREHIPILQRDMTDFNLANMESQYDYGSRAGIWRIYEAFKGKQSVNLPDDYRVTDFNHRLQDASYHIRCCTFCQQSSAYGRGRSCRRMGDGESWVPVSHSSLGLNMSRHLTAIVDGLSIMTLSLRRRRN
jgi:hypothetical protein